MWFLELLHNICFGGIGERDGNLSGCNIPNQKGNVNNGNDGVFNRPPCSKIVASPLDVIYCHTKTHHFAQFSDNILTSTGR